MNIFAIIFLTICGLVALGGVVAIIKAQKVLRNYKNLR
jgi:hypothetical protein